MNGNFRRLEEGDTEFVTHSVTMKLMSCSSLWEVGERDSER